MTYDLEMTMQHLFKGIASNQFMKYRMVITMGFNTASHGKSHDRHTLIFNTELTNIEIIEFWAPNT